MLKSRRLLILLCLIAVATVTVFYLRDVEPLNESLLHGHHAHEQNAPLFPPSSLSHPVHQLVAKAGGDFQTVLARQSRSLNDAVAEYRRRYKIPPPPNFDKWYNFAKRKG